MGLGKTAIMIAAHAMEGPTEGEAEMVTLHSEDALEESVIVQVGQHEDTKKDRVMYTGFKQLNDRMGSIVPDGSVRSPLPSPCLYLRSTGSTLLAGVYR